MEDNTQELLKERGSRYGSYETTAELSQGMKNIIRSHDGWNNLTPYQKESLEMILHKISRIVNGDVMYIDSWDDIAGYAKLVSNIIQTPK